MSFAVFLLYVFLSFFRPIELFAPAWGEYRPMLIIWSIAFALALGRAVSRREMGARPVHLWLLTAVCVVVAVSQVAAGWAGGAVKALSEFSPSVMLFVLVVLNVTSLPRLKTTCLVFVMSMVLASGYSIAAYRTGQYSTQLVLRQNSPAHDDAEATGIDLSAADAAELVPAQDTSGWYLWRIRGMGFLNDPNDFAQALVVVLPLLWGAWTKGRFLRNIATVLLPGALVGYAIVLTQSRGAVIGIASLLFFSVRRTLGTVRTGVMMGVLGTAALVGNMAAGRAFSTQERSAEERIEAWTVGIQLVRKFPLFGAGYGNFLDHNPLTAHNSYVLCFAELGLVGYFIWLALIVLTYKGLSRGAENLPPGTPEQKMSELLRSGLLGFLTCAWFLSRTYAPTLYFVLAICVSAWWVALQSAPEGASREQLSVVPWAKHTLITLVVTMGLVYAFIVVHRLGG
jgi:hypothetical protein